MPGRPHHTDKWHRCVENVMDKGHDESSASAICTTSLQDAGEPIFEDAEAGSQEELKMLAETESKALRRLHLRGALSAPKTIMHEGKEHLVVPIVALMDGVIHAVNAATPERVTTAVLTKAAQTWNNRPLVLGHPVKDGRQCSANEPSILEAFSFGKIFNSRVEGTKLLMDGYVDPARAEKVGGKDFLKDLQEGRTCEVSVGAWVVTDGVAGVHPNGKTYKASWLETVGDHLAFLPKSKGACSCEMGCGSHRAAVAHLVTACSIDAVTPRATQEFRGGFWAFTSLTEQSLDERSRAVWQAVNDEWNEPPEPYAYIHPNGLFDDRVIVTKGEETWSVPYTVNSEGAVSLGTPSKVKQAWVAAMGKDCPSCDGTGQVKDGSTGKQKDCPSCDGYGKVLKAAAGARHSSGDMKLIQGMHDDAVKLGAACDRANYETAAAAPPSSDTVKLEGGRWTLYSNDGKRRLGEHATREDAIEQGKAIARSLERQGVK